MKYFFTVGDYPVDISSGEVKSLMTLTHVTLLQKYWYEEDSLMYLEIKSRKENH